MTDCPHCPSFVSKNKYVDECTLCGIGRTKCINSNYDSQDYTAKNEYQKLLKVERGRRIFSRFLKNCSLTSPNVLEIGCSEGILLQLLSEKKKEWRLTGIDPCQNLVTVGGFAFKRVRFEDFTCREKYGLIIINNVLEHMPDPVVVLNKARDLLVDGGKLLITVANYGGWWSKLTGVNWLWLNPVEHYYHYSVDGLKNMLDQQGFKVDSLRTYTPQTIDSLLNTYLTVKNFYNRGLLSIWPLRPLVFRFNLVTKILIHYIADIILKGAEIQLLAEKKENEGWRR